MLGGYPSFRRREDLRIPQPHFLAFHVEATCPDWLRDVARVFCCRSWDKDLIMKTLDRQKLDVVNKTRSNIFGWRGQFTPEFVVRDLRGTQHLR